MNSEHTSLVQLSQAAQMLANVNTVDEVAKIADMAEAFRVYARQADLGLEAQNYAAEVKVRAQRKGGKLLTKMEMRDGGDAMKARSQPSTELPPKLDDIGITRNQSSSWQDIAAIPEEDFEEEIEQTKEHGKEITTTQFVQKGKRHKRKSAKAALAEAGAQVPDYPEWQAHKGDFYSLMRDMTTASVDVIITDPPYNKEFLPQLENLSYVAKHILKPGGSMLVMIGQSYLPEVYRLLGMHMDYQWTVAYLTPGGQSAQMWARNVNTFWKPVLWFSNGDYTGNWVGDVCKSAVNDNDKNFHEWGQSESGMSDIVERFSQRGDVVLDPCMGAGTTGVVAVRLGRRFIGIDMDGTHVNVARQRIGALYDDLAS